MASVVLLDERFVSLSKALHDAGVPGREWKLPCPRCNKWGSIAMVHRDVFAYIASLGHDLTAVQPEMVVVASCDPLVGHIFLGLYVDPSRLKKKKPSPKCFYSPVSSVLQFPFCPGPPSAWVY